MKKTFVTVMPNHIGAFLKASRIFASVGVNITRVSYNKAVDSHMLFIDAEGTPEELERASELLGDIGYLQTEENGKSVVLLEFRLHDIPGSVTGVLELISRFNFNISYISSQENGTDWQYFKMGIVMSSNDDISAFLSEARKLCDVRTIDYDSADKNYDNSLFYTHFVKELSSLMNLSDGKKEQLLINTNLAMQQLDEEGVSPYRTFDSIGKFCALLSEARGNTFSPRISSHRVSDKTEIILIEPPCGSNTAIIRSLGEYLFIDTGYACYGDEMTSLFRSLIPDFDSIVKRVFVTHADVDHCGLLPLFDEIYSSPESADCLRTEYAGGDGFRERNPLHRPYIRICKLLTSYSLPDPASLHETGGRRTGSAALERTGEFDFGEMKFELYTGAGGHLAGESVLIDYAHGIVFSGDIFVNLKDMTEQQAEYNRYAPILMTSVDTDPQTCAVERRALFSRLGAGSWRIFGGHGAMKSYIVGVRD